MSLQSPNLIGISNTGGTDVLKVWSCINCRRRKVRCNRCHPCAPCLRNKVECVFPVSGRVPCRSRNVNSLHSSTQNPAELLGRLRRLEAKINVLGSQTRDAAAVSQIDHLMETSAGDTSGISSVTSGSDYRFAFDSNTPDGNSQSTNYGLHNGPHSKQSPSKPPQVSNNPRETVVATSGFWSGFCKEIEHIFEALYGSAAAYFHKKDRSTTMPTSGRPQQSGFYGFVLRNTPTSHHGNDLNPLPSQMLFLWQTYVHNVDPFIKVLHVPSMTKVIDELKAGHHSLGPSMQAFVLVISLAAIMSLETDEVLVNFNTSKDSLLTTYRLGAERAFEQADFVNAPDITVLQALAIYLTVLQNTGESKAGWVLGGVLVRVAVGMHLHRDSSHSINITPFETEMRRRLWWQICFIDSRSEDLGVFQYKISEGMFDTKLPANADDSDLDPGMSQSPFNAENWTNVTVSLIGCEIWKLSHRLQSGQLQSVASSSSAHSPQINERLEIFQQSQARIKDLYLKNLNSEQPLHSFVATITQLFLAKVDLILRIKQHSTTATESQSTTPVENNDMFILSLLIIEYTYALRNEPDWRNWKWQIQDGQPPWHALRIILAQLSTCQWEPICERAWLSTKRIFDSLPDAVLGDPRYRQLSLLVSTSQESRELHRQTCTAPRNAGASLSLATDVSTNAPLAKVGIGTTTLTWTPQDPLVSIGEELDNIVVSDYPSQSIDWDAWGEISWDTEPFWTF